MALSLISWIFEVLWSSDQMKTFFQREKMKDPNALLELALCSGRRLCLLEESMQWVNRAHRNP